MRTRLDIGEQIDDLARETSFRLVELRTLVTNATFALILPLALPELLVIRLLRNEAFKKYRTNIITVWQKLAE